jgi:hypothetical protein
MTKAGIPSRQKSLPSTMLAAQVRAVLKLFASLLGKPLGARRCDGQRGSSDKLSTWEWSDCPASHLLPTHVLPLPLPAPTGPAFAATLPCLQWRRWGRTASRATPLPAQVAT